MEITCPNCVYDDVSVMQYPCNQCDSNHSRFEPKPVNAPACKPAEDAVNHPAHYTGQIECINAMVQCFGVEYVKGFCLCNAFKYLWRCKSKHETPVEDVNKAKWYIEKYLEMEGEKND